MFISQLESERNDLLKMRQEAQSHLAKAPEGTLRVSKHRNRYQYYIRRKTSDRSGTYIKDKNIDVAKLLAQKRYAEDFLKQLNPRIELLSQLIEDYQSTNFTDIIGKYSKARALLIEPYVMTNEEYAQRWENESYPENNKYPEQKRFKTARGELVRSKSEVIIADTLLRFGIPYKYEAPFYHDNSHFFPDFTLLNVDERKLIYLEHFGMMDDNNYRESFFKKMNFFSSIGLRQGDNLIMTFEDSENPLDISSYIDILKSIAPKPATKRAKRK